VWFTRREACCLFPLQRRHFDVETFARSARRRVTTYATYVDGAHIVLPAPSTAGTRGVASVERQGCTGGGSNEALRNRDAYVCVAARVGATGIRNRSAPRWLEGRPGAASASSPQQGVSFARPTVIEEGGA